jgi:N-acetylneuraminic acid mutarotase
MVPMLRDKKAANILLLILCFVLVTLPNVKTVSVSEDSWKTDLSLPVSRAGLKAAVVNEKIYVIKLNITYEYDLHAWSTKTSMLTPRDSFGIVAFQNKIYCIGGRGTDSVLATNEVYDPISDSWETKTAMPTPRHGLEANLVNGKIFLISGLIPHHMFPDIEGTFELSNITEVYDPDTNIWTTKAPIPNPASNYASAVVNNKIYIISETFTQIYDPETDTWSFGTPPPFQVDMAGGIATTGAMAPERLYVIGGRASGLQGSGLEVSYTQIYNPMVDSWTLGTPLPTPRYDFATAVVNDQIFTIGGLTGAFVGIEQKNHNEKYTPIGYIPEFPLWTLLVMMAVVLIVVVFYRFGLSNKKNRKRI